MKGLSGFNLPQHQEVISNFIYYIRLHLDNSGREYEFSVAPELRIKHSSFNKGSLIPDIVIKKDEKTWSQPEIIIEVSRNRGYKADIRKVKKAVKNIRSLKEGFVFNYETGEGCRITKPDLDEEDGESYSEVLDFDLKECLRSA
jgi:Uma2 family endonuclease